MSRKSFTALADDLTGACEIAAIGHRPGLRSIVSMSQQPVEEKADLVVYDTETRLCGEEAAVAQVRHLAEKLSDQGNTRFLFKKTDSVMRGPIAAELSTLMRVMGMQRTILVPANPHLGRTIEDGIYRIDGVPLDETPFADDLHHPAKSAAVVNLLGAVPGIEVHTARPGDTLPTKGIIIGDARTEEDLDSWAGLWDDATLLAGGGGLFQALVKTLKRSPVDFPEPTFNQGQYLLVSGTTHIGQQAFLDQLETSNIVTVKGTTEDTTEAAGERWGKQLLQGETQSRGCVLRMQSEAKPNSGNATWVAQQLALATSIALQSGHVDHLIVEGGATAASIAMQLGWEEFEMMHAWGPGVVTLAPLKQHKVNFTIKPGSYPWPDTITREVWPELSNIHDQTIQ
ncbi:MAG: four-carbon acid sugar kinase family protein [Puniceicoccaceae bacterium]